MADNYYTIVTDSGTRKMLEAVNGGKKVNIAEFAVGDGGGSACTPATGQTGLKNEVWRGQVIDCYISTESENQLIVESVIPSDIGGFTIREMGLFDDSGTLIAVCNTPDTQKVRVSDGVVHELDLLMELALSNTESVELVVDPNIVTATKKDVENLRLEVKTEGATMAKDIENLKTDVGKKVNEVPGMGLSSNDYTDEEKNKLNNIESGAEVNVQTDWLVTDSTSDAYIKNKPTIPPKLSGGNQIYISGENVIELKKQGKHVSDWNTAIYNGFYQSVHDVSEPALNRPDNNINHFGIVIATATTRYKIIQYVWSLFNDHTVTVYERSCSNPTGETGWSAWTRFVEPKGGTGKYIQSISETNGKISASEASMPTSLKNPNALTFTGGATVSYDGSSEKSVEVPYKISQLDNDEGYLNNIQAEALVAKGINDFASKVSNDGIKNTFKELVDYVAEHGGEAAAMASDIEALKLSVGDKVNKTLTVVTDWNNATETGFYVCTSESTLHNPAPLKFFGIVISLGDDRVMQILYNYVDVSVPGGIQVVFMRLGKKVDDGTFVWLPFADQTKKPNSKDEDGIVSKGSGHVNKVWKTDASGNPGWRDDTTYNIVSKTANGLVPKLPNESTVTKFLRQDGTWSAPTVPANESGVWTPKVCYNNAGALTELSASDKKGFYVKTGRLVYLKGFVTLSSMFNSEYFYIQGLPLAKNNNADNFNLETGNAYFLSGNAEIPKNLTPYKADGISFFNQNTLTLYKNTDVVTTALCFTIVYVSYT